MAETSREWGIKVTITFCCINDGIIYCMKELEYIMYLVDKASLIILSGIEEKPVRAIKM
jgi:hypothetical protein